MLCGGVLPSLTNYLERVIMRTYEITYKGLDGKVWNGTMRVNLVRDDVHARACIQATLSLEGYTLVTAKEI